MIVVGGTYSEICTEPIWENIFGSGFRAVNLILQNDKFEEIEFYTCADDIEIKPYLNYYSALFPLLKNYIFDIKKSPEFHYDHPLKTPIILPRPDVLIQNLTNLYVKGDNILVFGMIEASIKVEGDKVVYDPQSPVNPLLFSSTGSTANQLIVIVNFDEAVMMCRSRDLLEIKEFFFLKEKCHALIIKMGPKGAQIFQNKDDVGIKIPVYQTNMVWSIGSGDVFSAFFALNWYKGKELVESAILASKATALYCDSKDLFILDSLKSFNFPELLIEKTPVSQVYLAGPFFTFSQRWLVNQVWNALKGMGLKVFSPFHDVGPGKATDVVDKDLRGLDDSDIVFAIIDGLDSGTLFEVGYAISKNKKVIAFVQNESEESLKMLEGTNCIIEKDFTTAIYKLYWEIGK
jgi:nucleoside 2-deoxyribosyltransferase